MNQILSTNDEKTKSIIGLKPIIRFFAIVIIVIAFIFGGQSVYKLYKSMKYKEEFPKATLLVEKVGSSINLTVQDEIEISKIQYAWNNGNISEAKGIGRKKAELNIEIPQGENVLNITAVDVKGNKTKFESFKVEFSESDDSQKPIISVEKNSTNKKITITVKDDKALDYITYNWEGEEPVTVKASEENQLVMTEEITVTKGTKKLFITAYDKSGKTSTIEKSVVGSTGAQIKASVKDNKYFVVEVTSDYRISKINYTLNDVEHSVENIPKDAKAYKFEVELQEGVNLLKINAYEDDIMTEYKCKKTK